MPVAVTPKVAVWPAVTVWFAGCVVIEGVTAAAVTVKVAGSLVTLPTEPVTVTVNCASLSEVVVAGVVYEADVAPLMDVPFLRH